MLLSLLLACGPDDAVREELDAARSEAARDAAPPSGAWSPDVVVQISPELLERTIDAGLAERTNLTRRITIPGGAITPDLRVVDLRILPPRPRCKPDDGCFPVRIELDGRVVWATRLGDGQAPLSGGLEVHVELSTTKDDEAFVLRARPLRARDVRVTIDGTSRVVQRLVSERVGTGLDEAVAQIEPFEVTRFGEEIPLRALRVVPSRGGLRVDALTSFDVPHGVVRNVPLPTRGFVASVDAGTVAAFARRAAFEQGEVHGIQPEPRAVRLDGDTLAIDLRLWGGGAWYRDYEATAKLAVVDGELVVREPAFAERGASPGAMVADPLVHVASGVVPYALSALPSASFGTPAVQSSQERRTKTTTSLTAVRGQGGWMVVEGDLTSEGVPFRARRERLRNRRGAGR